MCEKNTFLPTPPNPFYKRKGEPFDLVIVYLVVHFRLLMNLPCFIILKNSAQHVVCLLGCSDLLVMWDCREMLLPFTALWHSILWVFLDAVFLSLEKFRASALMADRCLLCGGEGGSDSAGTGGASIPNYWRHQTSDLLMEGSFITDFFRQPPEVSFAASIGTECGRRTAKLLRLHPNNSCWLVTSCLSPALLDSCHFVACISPPQFWTAVLVHFLRSVWNFFCCLSYAPLLTSCTLFQQRKCSG